MLEITNARNGAVLNARTPSARETEDCLEFMLEGVADPSARVSVEGRGAVRDGKRFFIPVRLKNKFNPVTVVSRSKYGEATLSVVLVWDRNSFKRYHFYIDDCVFFLAEIAKERPKRLFDHFYPAMLRDVHREFGTKFMLNIFYRDGRSSFVLKDFPDIYKEEFRDNSDWLRLAFHSDAEMPQYAYRACGAEKLLSEYDRVHGEIVRFAGAETFTPGEAIHWCMFHPNLVKPLRERGVKVLSGWFIDCENLYGQTHPSMRFTDLGYNTDLDTALYLEQHNVLYDTGLDIFFNKNNLCLNLTELPRVVPAIDRICSNPLYSETIELYTHEQYSFPFYSAFLPDHTERIRAAVRRAGELGYRSVFFNDGLLGNPSWGD